MSKGQLIRELLFSPQLCRLGSLILKIVNFELKYNWIESRIMIMRNIKKTKRLPFAKYATTASMHDSLANQQQTSCIGNGKSLYSDRNRPSEMIGNSYAFLLTVLSLLIVCSSSTPNSLYGQISDANESRLQNATSGSSLDVLLEPTPYPAKVNESSTQFKVSFLRPGTNALQEHVDFNLRIYDNNSRVFQATNSTGQPEVPLHATDGVMTIPMLNYELSQGGEYRIEIPVYGILFNPIRPEYANFTINVLD